MLRWLIQSIRTKALVEAIERLMTYDVGLDGHWDKAPSIYDRGYRKGFIDAVAVLKSMIKK